MVNNIDEVLEFFKKNSILSISIKGDGINIEFDKRKFKMFDEPKDFQQIPQPAVKPVEESFDICKSIANIQEMLEEDIVVEKNTTVSTSEIIRSEMEKLTGKARTPLKRWIDVNNLKVIRRIGNVEVFDRSEVLKAIESDKCHTPLGMYEITYAQVADIVGIAQSTVYCYFRQDGIYPSRTFKPTTGAGRVVNVFDIRNVIDRLHTYCVKRALEIELNRREAASQCSDTV